MSSAMQRIGAGDFRRRMAQYYSPKKLVPEEGVILSQIEAFYRKKGLEVRAQYKKEEGIILRTTPQESMVVRGLVPQMKGMVPSVRKAKRVVVYGGIREG